MFKAKRIFFDLLFPPKCACCHAFLPRGEEEAALCDTCLKEWEKEKKEGICRFCGQVYSLCSCDARRKTCRADDSVYLVGYDLNVKIPARLILLNKSANRSAVFAFLAKELATRISEKLPYRDALITYCPRKPKNKRLAGYDQAEELAKRTAKNLSIPCLGLIGHKPISGEQKRLDKEQRKKNAAHAFVLLPGARETVRGKEIILIDDVSTTGSTLDRCANLLRKAGASGVCYAYVAKSNYRTFPGVYPP